MKKYYFALVAFCFLSFANGQIINFPDANFKAKLLAASPTNQIARNLAGTYIKLDANSDGEIQQSEGLKVKELRISNSNISDLTGINYLINLTFLECSNNQLTSIDLGNSLLQELYCNYNQLTILNLGSNTKLRNLICGHNQLTNLNLYKNLELEQLVCNYNLLTDLNVFSFELRELVCESNQITSLNFNSPNISFLFCSMNLLTNLNLSNCNLLIGLYCFNNMLTSLNLNNCTSLVNLECFNNQLTNLSIKNGKNEILAFNNNPNLKYICADDSQLVEIQSLLFSYSYGLTCNLNAYCSFTLGGSFYTIQTYNKLDINNNGCDAFDSTFTNLRYNITNGTNSGSLISNNSGNYSIPVQSGTHTITPILENPTYFNVSPTNATITFPATTSPAIQDFCITANGVHNDLEVTLLPLNTARPGYDASYKVVYKNKGNQTQSGAINLTFNDAVLDFITANPATTQVSNNLSWNFIDLQPFESREIMITLNVNSPMEIPALNSNDILLFTANVTSTKDETPNDNTAILNQTVVNSFDPNDKTCLEGNNIVPAKVGEYLHYMIRFENTGTFAAQNIVVKDMIDLAKFDIASLIPVKGSHDFYTRINGNKVEFIFENINLPFADATNDGYVAFKIKTKSTLVLGNSFSNSANIYFDYNFPIVTNTATTTVSNSLVNQDFEFTKYFNLYPNPAKNSLNIKTKNDLTISSLSIYNTLGQLVQVITSPTKTIDISELKTGSYFVKIVSDKRISGTKFIKE